MPSCTSTAALAGRSLIEPESRDPMDVTTETSERDAIERSHELPVVVDYRAAPTDPLKLTPKVR